MEGTISGLAAELNELFNRVDDVLNRIEILFSSEECRKCVKGLPVPSLLVFSSLLTMMREAPPEEPIPETTQEAATEPRVIEVASWVRITGIVVDFRLADFSASIGT
jgi:hypothetical protein